MVIVGLVVNELLSITENINLMGIPIPAALTKSIDALGGNDKPKDYGHKPLGS